MSLLTLYKNKIKVEEQTWVAIEPNWTSLAVVGYLKSGETSTAGINVMTSPIGSLSLSTKISSTNSQGLSDEIQLRDFSEAGSLDSSGDFTSGTVKAFLVTFSTNNQTTHLNVFPYIYIKGKDESGSDGATHFDYFEIYYTT